MCCAMADCGSLLDTDHFSCSICLHTVEDPVTIPCGHNYCMGCIKDYWDHSDHNGIYSCAQCRCIFRTRPVLGKNTMLAEVVVNLKKIKLHDSPSPHCYAGTGDVACDVCTGRKFKAAKSCLMCLASYCKTHLQPHYDSPAFKKHQLTDATGQLMEKICPHHDKLLEFYCRTDQQCICVLCVMDEHKGHDTVSAADGRTEKQIELKATQTQLQHRILVREEELRKMKQDIDSFKCSSKVALDNSDWIFTELIRSIVRRCSQVKGLIRDQEKALINHGQEVLMTLEKQIGDMRMRNIEMEKLLITDNDIQFLQSCQAVFVHPDPTHHISLQSGFGDMNAAVSKILDPLVDILLRKLEKIFQAANVLAVPAEPRTRPEFLLYACQLTLDFNTAHVNLCLSKENRVVTYSGKPQNYCNQMERFDYWEQVLCEEGLSGRCYWEVELRGNMTGYIAVSYREIGRTGKGDDCCFGANEKSWSFSCSPSACGFWHNNEKIEVPGPGVSRIGVYLDHRAGTLSFYGVSDTMTLLHKVQTTFTQPLYPGFWLPRIWGASEIEIFSLE